MKRTTLARLLVLPAAVTLLLRAGVGPLLLLAGGFAPAAAMWPLSSVAGAALLLHSARRAIRDAGARVRLISDGDVSAALLAVSARSPVDLLWGVGGTPEGVISAAAIKAIGGGLVGRMWPRNDEERKAALDAGYDLGRQLTQDDLVKGDDCFFSATGVTDGDVLQGVRH